MGTPEKHFWSKPHPKNSLIMPRPYLSLSRLHLYSNLQFEDQILSIWFWLGIYQGAALVTIYTCIAPLWGLITLPRMQVEVWSFQNIVLPAFQAHPLFNFQKRGLVVMVYWVPSHLADILPLMMAGNIINNQPVDPLLENAGLRKRNQFTCTVKRQHSEKRKFLKSRKIQ